MHDERGLPEMVGTPDDRPSKGMVAPLPARSATTGEGESNGARGAPKAVERAGALAKQVAGDHYSRLAIQPIEYIEANGLDYLQGNVIKYVTRHKAKSGSADVRKAIHYLELILKLQYGEDP